MRGNKKSMSRLDAEICWQNLHQAVYSRICHLKTDLRKRSVQQIQTKGINTGTGSGFGSENIEHQNRAEPDRTGRNRRPVPGGSEPFEPTAGAMIFYKRSVSCVV